MYNCCHNETYRCSITEKQNLRSFMNGVSLLIWLFIFVCAEVHPFQWFGILNCYKYNSISASALHSCDEKVCSNMSTVNPINFLTFMRTVGQLKGLKRTGWVNNDVHLPESVADHMYRMSMMSFMISDPSINKERLMKICLIHDLAESIVGDITPQDKNISKDEKRRMEEVMKNNKFICITKGYKKLFHY